MKECYSNNGDDFIYDSIAEVVSALLDEVGVRVGEVVSVWEGVAVQNPASRYLCDIAGSMLDRAYEESGAYSDSWGFSSIERESLQQDVSEAVDQWATKHKLHPRFYEVRGVVEHKVRITDDGFEIVDEAQDTA